MNRIKELRQSEKISLAKLSMSLKTKFGISASPQTLMRYENGNTQPKLETWQSLAEYFDVSVPYLQGLTDDRDNYDSWYDATGYTAEQIRTGLEKLKNTDRGTGNIQNDISYVVAALEKLPMGYGDDSAIAYVDQELQNLQFEIEERFYIDPEKREIARKKFGDLYVRMSSRKNEFYYDDVDPKIFDFVNQVLILTRGIVQIGATQIKTQDESNIVNLNESIKRLKTLVDSIANKKATDD